MEWIFALVTLTAMEIVLGIDNIVFISILCGKLPEKERAKARTFGLALAMITRILLLLSLTWVLTLKEPIFYLTDFGIPTSFVETEEQTASRLNKDQAEGDQLDKIEAETVTHATHGSDFTEKHDANAISIRDIILFLGGLFLIANSVVEIHHKLEGEDGHEPVPQAGAFWKVILQIGILDIIFSLDSVITAIGMTSHVNIMIVAVVISIVIMMGFAGVIERFIEKYPTVKVLALSFLILIGVLLVAEGIGNPVNKGYIYFAMAFSLLVEIINMQIRGGKGVPTEPEDLI